MKNPLDKPKVCSNFLLDIHLVFVLYVPVYIHSVFPLVDFETGCLHFLLSKIVKQFNHHKNVHTIIQATQKFTGLPALPNMLGNTCLRFY